MKVFQILIINVVIMGFLIPAYAGDVNIPGGISAKIDGIAGKARKFVPNKKGAKEYTKDLVHTWASGSINFSKAEKRESQKFKRTTYKHSTDSMKVRHLNERLKRIRGKKTELQLKDAQTITLGGQVDLIYREGADNFRYSNTKEMKAKKQIPDAQAKKLARQFLADNGFLQESKKDKSINSYVQGRFLSEDGDEQKKENPKDFLLQQDVVFERSYDGKPVINSKMVVGFHPDTMEVLTLKHYNWTPVEEDQAHIISKQKLQDSRAPIFKDEIKNRLMDKIKKTTGKNVKANVKGANEGWFQATDGLIPVLLVSVQTDYVVEGKNLGRDYLEVINLAGDDAALFPGQMSPDIPSVAPEPEKNK